MSLEASIRLHRAMMRDELDFTPSQRTPPVAFTYDESERTMVPDDRPLVYFVDGEMVEVPDSPTQSSGVGMPMSGRMYRYLSGPAPSTPWAHALFRLKADCRRTHPHHRAADRPYWRGSLCWMLVLLTVTREFSIHNAAKILRYDNPEPVLRSAFAFIEASIDAERAKAERRAREDEGHGPGAVPESEAPKFHIAFDRFHVQDCHRCHSLEETFERTCYQCRRKEDAA